MTGIDPLSIAFWLTILKIIVALGLGAVLIGSLYKFKAVIMTTFGLLLLSNLVILYLIMAAASK